MYIFTTNYSLPLKVNKPIFNKKKNPAKVQLKNIRICKGREDRTGLTTCYIG